MATNHRKARIKLRRVLGKISRAGRSAWPHRDPWGERASDARGFHHSGLLDDLRRTVRKIEEQYALHFGPPIALRADATTFRTIKLPSVHVLVVDFEVDWDFTGLDLWCEDPEKACEAAAWAYKRECGWDFVPGRTGTWVLAVSPTDGHGFGEHHHFLSANLVGFAALYDRAKDDDSETRFALSHIWVATDERKKGIGSLLVKKARELGAMRAEHPFTRRGEQLFRSAWPEQVAPEPGPAEEIQTPAARK
jgi:GNAT superfamily N-acetyltransferase